MGMNVQSNENYTLIHEMFEAESVRMGKIMQSKEFTNDELKRCVVHTAAKAAILKSLLDYVLEKNSPSILSGRKQLEKTGVFSGELTRDTIEKVYVAFDAGILTQKSDSGRASKSKAYEEIEAAKVWTLKEWEIKGQPEYEENKTLFSKVYVQLISEKYKNKKGQPLEITAETIKRWLPKTGKSGRPKSDS